MFQVFFSAWLSRVSTEVSQYRQDFLILSSTLIMLSMFCERKSVNCNVEIETLNKYRVIQVLLMQKN
jgi:hypothetical protein